MTDEPRELLAEVRALLNEIRAAKREFEAALDNAYALGRAEQRANDPQPPKPPARQRTRALGWHIDEGGRDA